MKIHGNAMGSARTALVLTLVLGSAVACGKKGDDASTAGAGASAAATTPPAQTTQAQPTITSVETGRHVGANNTIADSTSTFGVRDTMYVAVTSSNTPSGATLVARWTFETGQIVDSVTKTIANTDATNTTAVTEVHLVKATPWPTGKYTVDVAINGKSAGSKTIEVKK